MDFIGAYSQEHLAFLWDGFLVTLYVAFISIILSFFFGLIAGTLRYAKVPVLSQLIAVLVETIRNLPLLLIIFFTFFALPEIGIKLAFTHTGQCEFIRIHIGNDDERNTQIKKLVSSFHD